MYKILGFVTWVILIMWGTTKAFSMISEANTMENIVGVFFLLFLLIITYKTKCLTTIKFKKEHEK